MRVQGGADRHAAASGIRRDAADLQRCEGCGDAVADRRRAAAGQERPAGDGEVHRVRAAAGCRGTRRARRRSACASGSDQRCGPVGGVRRLPLEVRDFAAGAAAARRAPRDARTAASRSCCCISTSAARSRISSSCAGDQGNDPDLRRADHARHCRSATSTSAAGSASTTRGGFEEGSINYSLQEYANAVVSASRKSATSTRSRTRSSFPRAAGR